MIIVHSSMKTCKASLKSSEIATKIDEENAFLDMQDQLKAMGDQGTIKVPKIIEGKLPFPGFIDEKMVTPKNALKISKNIEKSRGKMIEQREKLENDDICSCPDNTEYLSIDSKDSSKALRVGKASLITFPVTAFTFGLSVLPYYGSKAVYLNKEDYFRDCVGKFDNAKKVEANWTGLINLDNVAEMDHLEELVVNHNIIENIEGIRGAKNLKRFNMNHNFPYEKIVDVDGKGKTVMEPVDLTPLSTIDGLEEVSVMGSSVTNVESLSNLRGLKRLNVSLTGTKMDQVKDVIINNKGLEFVNMMLSDVPQFTCNNTTFKSMRIGKRKIDMLRECLKDGSIKVEPYQKSISGKVSRLMKDWFASGELEELIKNDAMARWYEDNEECNGKISVSTKITKLSRSMKMEGKDVTYGVVDAKVKHDTDCTEGTKWSEPEKIKMCVKFSQGTTIVPMEECEQNII